MCGFSSNISLGCAIICHSFHLPCTLTLFKIVLQQYKVERKFSILPTAASNWKCKQELKKKNISHVRRRLIVSCTNKNEISLLRHVNYAAASLPRCWNTSLIWLFSFTINMSETLRLLRLSSKEILLIFSSSLTTLGGSSHRMHDDEGRRRHVNRQ